MARNTANPQRLALLSEPPGPPIKLAPGCPVMRFADVSPSLQLACVGFPPREDVGNR